ncbi:hypothetical protein niasHT_028538 [Heterodera trifolii]|uniref:Chromo domain-containing protein n=1 Tax=Heterodera trifolii TaxID=157864 RepID=A0ABD2KQ37_9BILA
MATRRTKRGVGENEFQVDSILARRVLRDGRVEYLLKWKGCSDSENSWEPEQNLNCADLMAKFNTQNQKGEPMDVEGAPSQDEVEEILGAARMNSEIFYLVKLKGDSLPQFFSSRIASEKFPKLVIDFYEQRVDMQ